MDPVVFASNQEVVLGLLVEIHSIEDHEVLQTLKQIADRIYPSYLQQVI